MRPARRQPIAHRMGYITADRLAGLADSMRSSAYGQYIRQVLEDE